MRDYKVGYKRPPTKSQFKSGQSGNPKGRPRRVRASLEELIEKALNRTRKVTFDGKLKKMTMREFVAEAVVNGAGKGQARYLKVLFELDKARAGKPLKGRTEIVREMMAELGADIEPRKKKSS